MSRGIRTYILKEVLILLHFVESNEHIFSQVQDMKQSLESQRKELNDCRAEITSLKMRIEGARSRHDLASSDSENVLLRSSESYREEIQSLENEIEKLKGLNAVNTVSVECSNKVKGDGDKANVVDESSINNNVEPSLGVSLEDLGTEDSDLQLVVCQDEPIEVQEVSQGASPVNSNANGVLANAENFLKDVQETPKKTDDLTLGTESLAATFNLEKMASSLLVSCMLVVFTSDYTLSELTSTLPGIRNHTNPFRCIAKNCSICSDQPSRGTIFLLSSLQCFLSKCYEISSTMCSDMVCDVSIFILCL